MFVGLNAISGLQELGCAILGLIQRGTPSQSGQSAVPTHPYHCVEYYLQALFPQGNIEV
jgi:hypothetical protein